MGISIQDQMLRDSEALFDSLLAEELDQDGRVIATPTDSTGKQINPPPAADTDYQLPIAKILAAATKLSPEQALKGLTTLRDRCVYSAEELFSPEHKSKRFRLLALEIAVNTGGLVAPYFRPETTEGNVAPGRLGDSEQAEFNALEKRLKTPGKFDQEDIERVQELNAKKFTPPQKQLYRDKLLVDIHWRLCAAVREGTQSWDVDAKRLGKFTLMEDSEIFWDDLLKYCAIVRTPKLRSEDMEMGYIDEVLMRAVHTDKVVRHKRNIEKGIVNEGNRSSQSITQRLQAWKVGKRGRAISVAEKVAFFGLLKLAGGDAGDAARLECFKTGVHFPVDDAGKQAFERRRKAFYRELEWYREHMKLISFKPY